MSHPSSKFIEVRRRVEAMRPFVEAGWSAREIAKELDLTRNAVIGTLERHFPDRPSRVSFAERKPRAPKKAPQIKANRSGVKPGERRATSAIAFHMAVRAKKKRLPLPKALSAAEIATPLLPRVQRPRHRIECAFIPGDIRELPADAPLFCGRPCADDSPFCPGHHRLCFMTVNEKKAESRAYQKARGRQTFRADKAWAA